MRSRSAFFIVGACAALVMGHASALPKPASIERPERPSQLTLKVRDELRARAGGSDLVSERGASLAALRDVARRYGLTFAPLIATPQSTLDRLEARALER